MGPDIGSEGVYVGVGIACAAGASFLANLIVPRVLSVPDSGTYFLVSSVVMTLSLLFRFGIDKSVIKALGESGFVEASADETTIARSAMLLGGLLIVGMFVILTAGGWKALFGNIFHSPVLVRMSLVGSVWVCAEGARLIFSETLRGKRMVLAATIVGDAGRSLLFVVLLLVLYLGESRWTIQFVIYAASCASVLTCGIAGAVMVKRLLRNEGQRIIGSIAARSLIVGSMPFYIAGVWSYMTNQADVVIGGVALSKVDLAHYAAASKLSFVVGLPMTALPLLLAPIIPPLWRRGKVEELEGKVRAAATVAAVPILLGSLALIMCSGPIMGAVYPAAYRESGPILSVLCVGPLSSILTGPNVFTLMMTGNGKAVVRVASIVGLIQLIGMCVCVAEFGVYGLAVASSGGTVVMNISQSVLVRRRLPFCTEPFVKPRDLGRVLEIVRVLRGG